MKLSEVLEGLKKLNPPAVLVTGPQRSGTTIAAHIIAQELGYRFVDEDEFGIHDGLRAAAILRQGKVVLQAPALMHVADEAANLGVPVVVLRRSIADIRKSEDRIGWRVAFGGKNLIAEQWKYKQLYGIDPKEYGDAIALIKYDVWDQVQKERCTSFDLDYESMKEHPLWADPKMREDFGARQWKPEQEVVHG